MKGRRSFAKDARTYAAEMGMKLELTPSPTVTNNEGEEISHAKVGKEWRKVEDSKREDVIRGQQWQGTFFKARWKDDEVVDCFSFVHELYHQLLPTKLYHQSKTGTITTTDLRCRLCNVELRAWHTLFLGVSH